LSFHPIAQAKNLSHIREKVEDFHKSFHKISTGSFENTLDIGSVPAYNNEVRFEGVSVL
jgi:hypothetical protein